MRGDMKYFLLVFNSVDSSAGTIEIHILEGSGILTYSSFFLFASKQFSYSSGSPRLSDKARFPNFFRLNMDETSFNEAIVALLKRFHWTQVAVVKQDEGIFNDVSENLISIMQRKQ